jgi:hypothetical protein
MHERVKLSEAQIMDTLREVVAEQPDYVYAAPQHMARPNVESCFYVHADADSTNIRPGCLVGAVLYRLGVPLERLAAHEGTGASCVTSVLVNTDDRAVAVLDLAQGAQDKGSTWSEALAHAERVLPTLYI